MASWPSAESKSLLKSDSLYNYILETTVYPRENPFMRELRLLTLQHPSAVMISSPDEAQFLGLLLKTLNAKNTLEIGVFTGYSLLATALALPDDGKIIAIDVSREFYEIGRPIIEKAGMAGKIDFRESPALPILDQLISEEQNLNKFDFAFVDADKANYSSYHSRLLSLVRVGGIIAYDNTLWRGTVALPPGAPLGRRPELVEFTKEFNRRIVGDERVEVAMLSVADGLTLCRRVV